MRVSALLLLAVALAATVDARGKSKKAMKTKRAKALDRPIPPSAGFDAIKGKPNFADKLTDRELKEHLRSLVARYDGDESRVQELLDSVLDDNEVAKELLPIKSTEDKFDAKYIILGAGPGGASSTPAPRAHCTAAALPPRVVDAAVGLTGCVMCLCPQVSSSVTTWNRTRWTT
jgi:hypothetical protein